MNQQAYSPVLSFRALLILLLLSLGVSLISGEYLAMGIVPMILILIAGLQWPDKLFYLLLVTIPLSAEVKLSQNFGTDFPDELLMWLITATLPLWLLLRPAITRSQLMHPLMIMLSAGMFWTLVTIFFTEHVFLSVKYFLAKTWYIIPFCFGSMAFLKNSKSLRIAAKCILIPMLFVSILVITRHAITGFSFEKVSEITKPFFRNHVNYAALLVCMIPVCFAVYRSSGTYRVIWLFATLLFVAALFFSFSRGAWLALGAALITIPFIIKRKMQWLILVMLAIIIGGTTWLTVQNRYLDYRPDYEKTIYHSDFDAHIKATYKMRDLSTAERFYRWIAALRMSRARLVTGYGPNSFYYEYKPYTVNAFTTYVSDNPEHSTVHNYFLLMLAEQGLPGLILFVLLYISMMMYAQRIYHTTSDRNEQGLMLVISALLSIISVLIFLSDLIETDKIGSIFFICLGLLAGSRERIKSGV